MKKLLISVLLVLIAGLACTYLFLPSAISIEESTSINSSSRALFRQFSNSKNLKKWWPGTIIVKDKVPHYLFNDNDYQITPVDYTLFSARIKGPDSILQSRIYFFAVNIDSTQLLWTAKKQVSLNPVERINVYLATRKLKKDMSFLLEKFRQYYVKPESLYGMKITIGPVVDTSMIAIFGVSTIYPTDKTLFNQVAKLQAYALSKGAVQSGYPMVNINTDHLNAIKYEVALPINKVINSSAEVIQKRLPPGRILMSEVIGGTNTIEKAITSIKNYGYDHKFNMYVIPFFALNAERLTEADTSKRVTKIFCPIF